MNQSAFFNIFKTYVYLLNKNENQVKYMYISNFEMGKNSRLIFTEFISFHFLSIYKYEKRH